MKKYNFNILLLKIIYILTIQFKNEYSKNETLFKKIFKNNNNIPFGIFNLVFMDSNNIHVFYDNIIINSVNDYKL